MKPFDKTTYLKDVLEPYLGTSDVPDLFERYCLDVDDSDAVQIVQRLKEVKALWDKRVNNAKYAQLLQLLNAKHTEAGLTLEDDAARARAAAETRARRSEQAEQQAGKRGAWNQALRDVVAERGGLDPSWRGQLEKTAAAAGIDAAYAKAQLDSAPVAAAPEVIADERRREVRAALAALAQHAGEERLGLTLFHALGLPDITLDRAELQAAWESTRDATAKLPHAQRKTVQATVVTLAKLLLLDADPRAYVEAAVADVRDALAAEGLSAAASGAEIDEVEALHLSERALALGLTPALAERVVVDIARENNVPLRLAGEVSYVACPRCNKPHRRSAGNKACVGCGAALFVTCPSCDAISDAVARRCPECGTDLHEHAAALRRLATIGDLLDDGRVTQAADDLAAAQRVLPGGAREIADVAPLVAARLEDGERRWEAVEEAWTRGNLYRARQLLHDLAGRAGDLPGLDGSLPRERLRQVTERLAEVDRLVSRARESSGGEREEALSAALRLAADCSEARAELDRIPPVAVTAVRAEADDAGAVVSWDASSTVGVEYRVSRATGAGSSPTPIGATAALRLEDHDVPAGAVVRYAVEAVRGRASSPPTLGPPLVVAKEVAGLVASDGDGEVTLRWDPPAAGRVVVTRRDGRGAQTQPAPDASGLRDRDVFNGERYAYRVQVEYAGLDGRPLLTPGRTVYGQPRPRPQPVALAAEPRGTAVVLRFPAPPAGTVAVLRAQSEPPLEPGAEVDPTTLGRYGERLPGDSTSAVDDQPAPGRAWYLPVTVSGGVAVAGPVLAHLALPEIQHVAAASEGPSVRVTWEWPDGVRLARVVWRRDRQPAGPDDPAAAQHDVRYGQYRDEGGFTLEAADSEPVFVAVYPAARIDGDILAGSVAGKGARAAVRRTEKTDIRYTVRRTGLLKKKLEVEVVAADGRIPPLVVVARSGDLLPRTAADGEVLARLGGDGPRQSTLDIDGRRPLALRLFFDSLSSAATHRLFDPGPDELMIG